MKIKNHRYSSKTIRHLAAIRTVNLDPDSPELSFAEKFFYLTSGEAKTYKELREDKSFFWKMQEKARSAHKQIKRYVDSGLIEKSGNMYELTPAGIELMTEEAYKSVKNPTEKWDIQVLEKPGTWKSAKHFYKDVLKILKTGYIGNKIKNLVKKRNTEVLESESWTPEAKDYFEEMRKELNRIVEFSKTEHEFKKNPDSKKLLEIRKYLINGGMSGLDFFSLATIR
ncbi:hypothetical protein K8R30_02545 [archaeon]|nr:hypothetical protein [archaeon]